MTRTKDKGALPPEESFATRWSRRKRSAHLTPPPETGAESAPAPADAPDDRPDEEILKELGLPDPDTLGPGDDFKAFLTKAVPARLRHRALRRLWISDPVFANLDNLVDYAEDFTYAAGVTEKLQTVYEVGKGFTQALSKKLDAEKTASPHGDTVNSSESSSATARPGDVGRSGPDENSPASDQTAATAEGLVADGGTPDAHSPQPESARKRMRFRLAEE